MLLKTFSFAQGSELSAEMLPLNLKARTWSEELPFLKDFAASTEAVCKTWSPRAFQIHPDLAASCQFPTLLKAYEKQVKLLQSPQRSGLALPALSIEGATIPALQSGAWQRMILAESDGTDSALKMITLRLALQKSLQGHARWIRRTSPEILNPFASLVVPRMIASFSGYSRTLQSLAFLNAFECGAQKTLACKELQTSLRKFKSQVLAGIGPEDFFTGLSNFNSENVSTENFRATKAQQIVRLLSKVKTELSIAELLSASQGTKVHPLYEELRQAMDDAVSNLSGDTDAKVTEMLVATSILSEIYEAQAEKAKQDSALVAVAANPITKKTTEEMSLLKSYVLSVLHSNEVIQ